MLKKKIIYITSKSILVTKYCFLQSFISGWPILYIKHMYKSHNRRDFVAILKQVVLVLAGNFYAYNSYSRLYLNQKKENLIYYFTYSKLRFPFFQGAKFMMLNRHYGQNFINLNSNFFALVKSQLLLFSHTTYEVVMDDLFSTAKILLKQFFEGKIVYSSRKQFFRRLFNLSYFEIDFFNLCGIAIFNSYLFINEDRFLIDFYRKYFKF